MEDTGKTGILEDSHQIVESLTLMDDELMSRVFDKNIPAAELLLRTILGRDDIQVVSVVGQMELKSPVVGGRTIRLDIVVKESNGKTSDVEVQRRKDGAHPRRARFHSSMLDSRMLKEGKEFKTLEDSYTIFITESDYFGDGLPIYTIQRHVEENGRKFEDGSHILYVNGSYTGDDPLGIMMADFKCKNAKDMHYPELAQGVKHFKEEGEEEMSEIVENYAKAYAARCVAQLEAEKKQAEAEKKQAEAEVELLRARLALYEPEPA